MNYVSRIFVFFLIQSNSISLMKSRRTKLAEHVAGMVKMTYASKMLVGKPRRGETTCWTFM